MRQGVLIDETVEGLVECAGHFWRSPRTRAILQAVGSLRGKALHPVAEGGVGKMAGCGDGCNVLARHSLTDGVRTAKDASFLGLLEHGVSGRQCIVAALAWEGTPRFAPWG